MSSTDNPGRVAGFLYLLLLAAPLRLIYIPSKLFVHGNATATANNIAAHETLFRFGIVGDLFHRDHGDLCRDGPLPIVWQVDQNLAVLMVDPGWCPAIRDLLLQCTERRSCPDARARRRLLVRIRKTSAGRSGHAVPPSASARKSLPPRSFGVWLFPLGVLAYRSRFLPRFWACGWLSMVSPIWP